MRALQAALDRHDAALSAACGLGRSDWLCLRWLARPDVPGSPAASPGAIQRALGLTSGSVTALLDRLERRGLVRRCADPADRRALRIELCEDGARLLEGANASLAELTGRLAGRWGAARARVCGQACHDLAKLVDWASLRVAD